MAVDMYRLCVLAVRELPHDIPRPITPGLPPHILFQWLVKASELALLDATTIAPTLVSWLLNSTAHHRTDAVRVLLSSDLCSRHLSRVKLHEHADAFFSELHSRAAQGDIVNAPFRIPLLAAGRVSDAMSARIVQFAVTTWGKAFPAQLSDLLMATHGGVQPCGICLERIDVPDAFIACRHAFHEHCLQTWVQCSERWVGAGDATCPLCRVPVSYVSVVDPFLQLPPDSTPARRKKRGPQHMPTARASGNHGGLRIGQMERDSIHSHARSRLNLGAMERDVWGPSMARGIGAILSGERQREDVLDYASLYPSSLVREHNSSPGIRLARRDVPFAWSQNSRDAAVRTSEVDHFHQWWLDNHSNGEQEQESVVAAAASNGSGSSNAAASFHANPPPVVAVHFPAAHSGNDVISLPLMSSIRSAVND